MKTILSLLSAIIRAALTLSIALAAVAAAEGSAHAATGFIKGKWKFFNVNGNYCPSSATSCVGTRVPQLAFNADLNISNARVYVQDMDGNPIGQAVTNNLGEFTAQWTGAIAVGGSIRVGVTTVHSRFTVGGTSGTPMTFFTLPIGTSATSTASSPQNLGNILAGSPGVANAYFNTFFAVELLYRNVLSLVGVFTNNFTGVEIRGFANTMPGFILDFAPSRGATRRCREVNIAIRA